jgi:hypothetical protein
MSPTTKQRLIGLGCLVFGIGIAWAGLKDKAKMERLKESGVTVPAQPSEIWIERGRKGSKTYKVNASYTTKDGSIHQKEFVITKAIYDGLQNGPPTLNVRYLPNEPDVAEVEGGGPSYLIPLVIGSVMALAGVAITYSAFTKKPEAATPPATPTATADPNVPPNPPQNPTV